MQEPGRRPFVGVDLRRPKGYPAPAAATVEEHDPEPEPAGDPCPRCESRDTKFCYYNNYNTSQPRHYCKSCRRHWTKGGSLRNVPVGGATRGKGSVSSSSPAAAPKNAKRSRSSKRRRVAPAPDPAAPSADVANEAAATLAPPTEAAATDATADPAAPQPPVADGGFADTSVALGLGLADGNRAEIELPDPSPLRPSGCDLGSYWSSSVFADSDPALFLNLP